MWIESFSSSHFMPTRRTALVASEEYQLCLEFLLCILPKSPLWALSKLSDLVNSLGRSGNSGIVENVCKLQREDPTLFRMSCVSQTSFQHSSCSMLLTEFGSGENCSLFLGS